jgi:hypothetical protein
MAKWRPPTPPQGGGVPRDEFEGPEEPTGVRVLRFLEARMQRLELRDAQHFGIEGAEGAWQRHEEEDKEVHKDVKVLMGFRTKALLLIGLAGSALGVIAEVVSHLVEKALK